MPARAKLTQRSLPHWTTWAVFIGGLIGAVWALYQIRDKVREDWERFVIDSTSIRTAFEKRTGDQVSDSLAVHVRTFHGRTP